MEEFTPQYKKFISSHTRINDYKTVIFRVKLAYNKRTFRDIELLGENTLEDLHLMILKTFSQDYDHLHAFFLDNKRWSRAAGVYANEDTSDPESKKTNEVRLDRLILIPQQKFLYLYDYGDEWTCEVEFRGLGKVDKNISYPRAIKVRGEFPRLDNFS